jgi:hypothetical protein
MLIPKNRVMSESQGSILVLIHKNRVMMHLRSIHSLSTAQCHSPRLADS